MPGSSSKAPSKFPRHSHALVAGGALLGLGGALAATFFATKVLGNAYYIEWATISLAGIFSLLAWILYLRDDRILERGDKSPGTKAARIVLLAAASLLVLFTFLF